MVLPIAAVVYKVTDEALERYQRQHHISSDSPTSNDILQYVESEILMPVSLASLEDSDLMFLC